MWDRVLLLFCDIFYQFTPSKLVKTRFMTGFRQYLGKNMFPPAEMQPWCSWLLKLTQRLRVANCRVSLNHAVLWRHRCRLSICHVFRPSRPDLHVRAPPEGPLQERQSNDQGWWILVLNLPVSIGCVAWLPCAVR